MQLSFVKSKLPVIVYINIMLIEFTHLLLHWIFQTVVDHFDIKISKTIEKPLKLMVKRSKTFNGEV